MAYYTDTITFHVSPESVHHHVSINTITLPVSNNNTLTVTFKWSHVLPWCVTRCISLLIGGRLCIITDCTPSAYWHTRCQCSVACNRVWLGDTSRFTRTAYRCWNRKG